MYLQIIYIYLIYMYKEDLALNNPQELIYHKANSNSNLYLPDSWVILIESPGFGSLSYQA